MGERWGLSSRSESDGCLGCTTIAKCMITCRHESGVSGVQHGCEVIQSADLTGRLTDLTNGSIQSHSEEFTKCTTVCGIPLVMAFRFADLGLVSFTGEDA